MAVKKIYLASRSSCSVILLLLAFLLFPSRQAFADTLLTDNKTTSLVAALRAGGTVTYAIDATVTLTNAIIITNDVVLSGAGHTVAINGNNKFRQFTVTNGAVFSINFLSVTNGRGTNGGSIRVEKGATLNIDNVVFIRNHATNANGANPGPAGSGHDGTDGGTGGSNTGGAIYNLGFLNITNATFTGNITAGGNGGNGATGDNGGNGGIGGAASGGAIYNSGTNSIVNTTFDGNEASAGFGGNGGNGIAGLPGTGGHGGIGSGGAIYNLGYLTVAACTFLNQIATGGDSAPEFIPSPGGTAFGGGAGFGGGIYNGSIALVENCTFFHNLVGGGNGANVSGSVLSRGGNGGTAAGGAVLNVNPNSLLALTNCTLAANDVFAGTNGVSTSSGPNGSPGQALGANVYRAGTVGTLRLANSILLTGISGANAAGAITDGGYNISSDGTPVFAGSSTSANNIEPMIATDLADNGGATETLLLLQDSPAIDHIPPKLNVEGVATNFPATDQRDAARSSTANADAGAVELEATLSVSGKIFSGTNGASGVEIKAFNSESTNAVATTTSSANGFYIFNDLLIGDYTITPTPVGSGFDPESQDVTLDPDLGPALDVNFSFNDPEIFGSLANVTNKTFAFQIAGAPSQVFSFQASTNLVDWVTSPAKFTNNTSGTFSLTITNVIYSDLPKEFFRIIIP
jgi:hypothetical protein